MQYIVKIFFKKYLKGHAGVKSTSFDGSYTVVEYKNTQNKAVYS